MMRMKASAQAQPKPASRKPSQRTAERAHRDAPNASRTAPPASGYLPAPKADLNITNPIRHKSPIRLEELQSGPDISKDRVCHWNGHSAAVAVGSG